MTATSVEMDDIGFSIHLQDDFEMVSYRNYPISTWCIGKGNIESAFNLSCFKEDMKLKARRSEDV